jgi:uncharacterized protein (DUF924 family)
MSNRAAVAPAARFVALAESGHATLDLRTPRSASGLSAWKRREPWFPEGSATEWRDVYRTWFGNLEVPLVNLHLMGAAPPAWDEKVRGAYGRLWREAADGGLADWETSPKALMAKLILIDQLPRHMFRGKAEAFATDGLALQLTERLVREIASGNSGLHIEDAIMVALPWVHSEQVHDIYRAVWWHTSLAEAARGTPYHLRTLFNRFGAENHIYVLQRFGRYPHRNVALGRTSTVAEVEHVARHAEIWELQQAASPGTLRYRIKAAKFVLRMCVHTIGFGEARALLRFIARPSFLPIWPHPAEL